MSKKNRWNTKCTACGSDAYQGFTVLECSNRACKHYKEFYEEETPELVPKLGFEFDEAPSQQVCPPPNYGDPVGNPHYNDPSEVHDPFQMPPLDIG